jgi:hypothetical protein
VTIIGVVRQSVAALLLAIIASLSAVDGVCCPDGCTQERQSSTFSPQTSSDGACVLCVGIDRSPHHDLSPGAVLTRRIVIPIWLATGADSCEPFEHPPRT